MKIISVDFYSEKLKTKYDKSDILKWKIKNMGYSSIDLKQILLNT